MHWINIVETIRELRDGRVCGGSAFCVNAVSKGRLVNILSDLSFAIFEIDGETIETDDDLPRQLGRLLHFPDYYGGNWDAFDECFGDLAPEAWPRIAFLWENAEVTASRNLGVFASGVIALFNLVSACRAEVSAGTAPQVELILLGTGPGFVRLG